MTDAIPSPWPTASTPATPAAPVTRGLEPRSPVVSLRAWLTRAAAAGVPHVPATFGPAISIDTVFAIIDHAALPEHEQAFTDADAWLHAQLATPRTMWRWDACAPDFVKFVMARGRGDAAAQRIALGAFPSATVPDGERMPHLHLDDPRFVDILFEDGRTAMPLCVRPWIDAVMVDGFPVEFRVFVSAERQIAVASYYLQRPLDTAWHRVAELAVAHTRTLVPHAPEGVAFTVDFLVRQTATGLTPATATLADVWLLEGGPGWGRGAHHCCFAPQTLTAHLAGPADPARPLPVALAAEPGTGYERR